MNPLFATMVGILHLLKRKCPKCHREQSVPADKISTPFACKYCGSMMKPQDKDSGYGMRRHKAALFHDIKKKHIK